MQKRENVTVGRDFKRKKDRHSEEPKKKNKYYPNGRRYIAKVPFDVWWNEFFSKRTTSGDYLYVSAWKFIKAKTKNPQERKWLWMAIGPKPTVDTKKQEGVPYLGDWQQTRKLMLAPDNSELKKMEEVLQNRLDAGEASKGLANLTLVLLQKFLRYDGKVDEVLGDSPVLDGLSLKANEERARIFYAIRERGLEKLERYMDWYLRCHGVTRDDQSVLANAMAAGANAALRTMGQHRLPEETESPVLPLMMQSFIDKARIFKMQLPDGDVVDVEAHAETEKEPVRKHGGNGHG